MASIFRRPSGTWTVEVYLQDRKKHKINLPTKSQREARRVADNVQRLVNCRKTGLDADELLPWLDKLQKDGTAIYARLGDLGLVECKPERVKHSLQETVDILSEKMATQKPNTQKAFSAAMKILFRHFPPDTFIEEIDSVRVYQFMTWIHSPAAKTTGGVLSNATIARGVVYFRSVFSLAVQFGWISENPFMDIKKGSMVNAEKWQYLSRDFVMERIKEHRDDVEALCVALARFAGLRGLSELNLLAWCDIHFSEKEQGFIVVRAPKVKGSKHETRTVPLAPFLEALLRKRKEQTADSLVFGTVKLRNTSAIARSVLGDGLLVPWYNLRKSFCSDVMETGVDMKIYEEICGHRWTIGEKYYQILHPDRLRSGLKKVALLFSGDISGDSKQEKPE